MNSCALLNNILNEKVILCIYTLHVYFGFRLNKSPRAEYEGNSQYKSDSGYGQKRV